MGDDERPGAALADRPTIVAVISDTHGWLDPAVLTQFVGAAHIVHAGDIGQPGVIEALKAIAPVTAVRGNVDGGPLRDLPDEAVVEVAGIVIAVRHIVGRPGRPNAPTRALLDRTRPRLLVYGHSHMVEAVRAGATVWINPGAAGHEGFHERRTAALLHLTPQAEPQVHLIDLGPRGRVRASPA